MVDDMCGRCQSLWDC